MSSEIHVQNQARLSLSRVVKLVVSGIRHRLLRSTLTVAVILLAVAFFMSMLTESGFVKSTGLAVREEINRHKAPARQLTYLFSQPSKEVFLQDLATLSPSGVEVMVARTGTRREDVERLRLVSGRVMVYYDFFEAMDVGKRLALIGKRKGLDIFRPLVEEKEWKRFLLALDPMHSVKIPGEIDEFRGFLDRLSAYGASLDDLHGAWLMRGKAFAEASGKLMEGSAPEVWLRTASPGELDRFVTFASEDGFALDRSTVQDIQAYLKDHQSKAEIISVLNSPEGRKRWAETFRARHKLDEKLALLDDPRAKTVLADFSSEEVDRISEQLRYSRHLENLSDALQGKSELEGDALLSRRQIFLLAVSFIVCMVGISNAMLMSITERFREIATMKCLGATDGFILLQFLVEAAIQGMLGGIFGMVIGLILSFFKNYLIFGGFMVTNINLFEVLIAGVISLGAGVLLSMAASIYPSWSASRMAPMEAMRIE